MRIDGINSSPATAAQAMKKPKPAKDEKPAETTAVQDVEKIESEEKTRGVIRLLQEGHFKGVADVRLRINFYDEIQALETQNLKTIASNSFEGFNQTVQDQVTALKESGLLDDGQIAALDAFLEKLQNAQGKFMADPDPSTLIQTFQNELDSLLALFAPPAPEPLPVEAAVEQELEQQPPESAADETVPAEIPAETPAPEPPVEQVPAEPVEVPLAAETEEPLPAEPSPLQQLVKSFQQSIQQAIDNLNANLTSTSALPPISEPAGNGATFSKFLAIYESMRSGAATNIEEPQSLDFEEVILPEDMEVVSELT